MEFGKLTDVENIDWKIPADDPLTKMFLTAQKTRPEMQLFFGAPAWGHSAWVGKVYPAGSKRLDYLFYYSRHFTCIELNTSHYRIPTDEQVQQWIGQVPQQFLFCPKVFQGISHTRHGLLDRKLSERWFNFLERLGIYCGPCFLQLPPHFDYSSKAELFTFLKNWPGTFSLALEFRHPSWFQNGKILPALTEYLQRRRIGLVITDVAGRRDVLHTSISANFCLLRFIGNNLHLSDFDRARVWAERFANWQTLGLQKLFLFIHEPDDISVPEMTDFFLDRLSESGRWDLKRPLQTEPQLRLEVEND